ncbi:hypothetical protein K1719_016836 [Acacia pycnantha]|nr:hypothetical protein K1719_016836 [Acacia pycnantha]
MADMDQSGMREWDEECKTPKNVQNQIPAMLVCPPPPRKKPMMTADGKRPDLQPSGGITAWLLVIILRGNHLETKDNWKWFLTLLEEDLGDHVVYGWNFISDQQKGLLQRLKEVMPRAHHRLRVQHVWKNFMKQWRDKQLRALVWECARCTTIPKFEKSMQKLKALNEATLEILGKH